MLYSIKELRRADKVTVNGSLGVGGRGWTSTMERTSVDERCISDTVSSKCKCPVAPLEKWIFCTSEGLFGLFVCFCFYVCLLSPAPPCAVEETGRLCRGPC